MFVKEVVLQDFRNYQKLDLPLDSSKIFISGANGVGKTNFIEAIFYLTLGRSFRKTADNSLIRKDSKEASVFLRLNDERDGKDHTLSGVISPEAKSFAYDDKELPSLSKVLGKLLAVIYDPEMAFFYKEEPAEKRKLLDEVGSQLSTSYLYSLSRYKKLLRERNQALSKHYDSDIVKVYRNQLISLSYRIVMDRKSIVKELSSLAESYYTALFGEEHHLLLSYHTNCPLSDDEESFRKEAASLFDSNQSLENLRLTTLIGPHRDDLKACLDGKDVSLFGSQGENRLASLSLRLGIRDLYKKKLGVEPILLLDDVASDLDDKRQANLFRAVGTSGQVFLTGARIPKDAKDYAVYESVSDSLTRRN
jgi:DNA replication and repair protein RecF